MPLCSWVHLYPTSSMYPCPVLLAPFPFAPPRVMSILRVQSRTVTLYYASSGFHPWCHSKGALTALGAKAKAHQQMLPSQSMSSSSSLEVGEGGVQGQREGSFHLCLTPRQAWWGHVPPDLCVGQEWGAAASFAPNTKLCCYNTAPILPVFLSYHTSPWFPTSFFFLLPLTSLC